ncbi:hypothetical protein T440DRAFT_132301 [Plenodomus tracheiphilus IPT5]|uniref:C2H2-type domain-containing protein n=1 Tax=Plenodomus tracheiphilus IPT5 TaxID=1408161 RepID=A0A6A7B272_9PLEO|nr:hypothetical protein T440DRAFT_132301 [Plenodomus tracheiphilus IPT5]
MTHRSSEQYTPPKPSTISRRLRNRANQNLVTRPAEFPRRSVISLTRRAATLPRRNHIAYQTPEPQTSTSDWESVEAPRGPSKICLAQSAPTYTTQSHDFLVNQQAQSLSDSDSPSSAPDNQASPKVVSAHDYHFQPAQALSFLPSPLLSATGSRDFEPQPPANPEQPHDSPLGFQDMSTLGFMMAPSQYGMNHYGSPPTTYSPNYPPQHSYAEQRSTGPGPYSSSYASSPSLTNDGHTRRQEPHTVLPPYQPQQSLPRSPFQPGQPQESMRGGSAPLASSSHNYTYSAPSSSLPSQPLGSNAYPPPQLYPPSTYGVSDYHPLPTMYPPSSTTPAAYPSYDTPNHPPSHGNTGPPLSSSPGAQHSAVMPRLLNSRPKPTCWDHGCNGRQFSTFSNLLRHQREKSGTASKSFCPKCGAEFTRTTARNGHMAHDKCKARRASESDR